MPKKVDTTPYYKKLLDPLIGCRVVAMVIADDESTFTPFIGYRLFNDRTGKMYELVALSDAEGNGPGHLSVVEVKDVNQ
jgi:hypothetical protein